MTHFSLTIDEVENGYVISFFSQNPSDRTIYVALDEYEVAKLIKNIFDDRKQSDAKEL